MRTRKASSTEALEEVETLARSAYDRIANDYYTMAHPTSRAFDSSMDRFIRHHPFKPVPGEFYLDVGCGKTRLHGERFTETSPILVDISHRMLLHSLAYPGCKILASAFRLPFVGGFARGVYSFLGDAFGTTEFFREVFRVLTDGGHFLYSCPSHTWALSLRKKLGISLERTVFTSDEATFLAPSFAPPKETMTTRLKQIGFVEIRSEDLFLPREYPTIQIPDHISIAAQELRLDPYDVPILSVWSGKKRDTAKGSHFVI